MDSAKEFREWWDSLGDMHCHNEKSCLMAWNACAELLAARHAEIGPCRKHPKMFTDMTSSSPKPPCTLCQEVLAAEAAVLRNLCEKLRSTCPHIDDEDHSHCVRCGIAFEIENEITPSRTAALDKRLEEAREPFTHERERLLLLLMSNGICTHDAEPDFCDGCKFEWEKRVAEALKIIRSPLTADARQPEAVCPTCLGTKFSTKPSAYDLKYVPCPDCRGTSKAGKVADGKA